VREEGSSIIQFTRHSVDECMANGDRMRRCWAILKPSFPCTHGERLLFELQTRRTDSALAASSPANSGSSGIDSVHGRAASAVYPVLLKLILDIRDQTGE
jgi:hypothetical protein